MIRRLTTIAIISTFLAGSALAQQPKAERQAQRQQQLRKLLRQGNRKTAKKSRRNANQAEGQRVQKLQRALKLSDTQAEQVRSLMATRNQKLTQLRNSAKGQRKQDAQAIREEFQTGLRGVLSPDQAQLLENRRNGRKSPAR